MEVEGDSRVLGERIHDRAPEVLGLTVAHQQPHDLRMRRVRAKRRALLDVGDGTIFRSRRHDDAV